MARPRAGTEKGDAASAKWKQTMLKKYGKEGLLKKLQENGRIGGSVRGIPKGFASPFKGKDGLTGFERSRIAGAKGGKISRRGGAKKPQHSPEDGSWWKK